MAPSWLFEVRGSAVSVTSDFMGRLKSGDASASKALHKVDLTSLYRRGYSRRTKWETPGLFWGEGTPLETIPIVLGGRHAQGPWIPDYLMVYDRPKTEQRLKKLHRDAKDLRKGLNPQRVAPKRKPASMTEGLFQDMVERQLVEEWQPKRSYLKAPEADLKVTTRALPERWIETKPGVRGRYEAAGWEFKAVRMKINPKFELVVVNRHDRAALLKLLAEIDKSPTVEKWLSDRTQPGGSTASSILFADYGEWCNANEEVALGPKAFAQALIANGVVKLTRSRGGERYEIELSASPHSAHSSGG